MFWFSTVFPVVKENKKYVVLFHLALVHECVNSPWLKSVLDAIRIWSFLPNASKR
jgi:hypothetical protein